MKLISASTVRTWFLWPSPPSTHLTALRHTPCRNSTQLLLYLAHFAISITSASKGAQAPEGPFMSKLGPRPALAEDSACGSTTLITPHVHLTGCARQTRSAHTQIVIQAP
jgi:hypothetical protein